MVRLVKGAYWDSEIKRAQLDGLEGYPVYTRKAYTDVSYLACARKLLARPTRSTRSSPRTTRTRCRPSTLAGSLLRPAAVRVPVPARHGRAAVRTGGGGPAGQAEPPCRIYAPVGTHETLLAYLVRRLLENGANTSFVNRIADETIRWKRWSRPGGDGRAHGGERRRSGCRIRAIPLPRALYGASASIRAGSTWRTSTSCARWRRCARRWHPWRASRCWPKHEGAGAARPRPCATRPTTATWSGGAARRRRRRRAPRCAGRMPRRVGGHAAGRARALLERAADLLEAHAAADGPADARSRQDLCQRHRRSARGGRLPALLRGTGAQRFFERHARPARTRWSASARGISRWPSSSARWPPRSPRATPCWPSRPNRRR
jgi:hypothetical protein